MVNIDKQRLVRAAARARERAVAPYSKFKVGAAMLAKNGEIISGANVESASYGLTCCAGRPGAGRGQPRIGQNQGIPGAGTSVTGVCHPLKFRKRKLGCNVLLV
jgi:hypothetical protein